MQAARRARRAISRTSFLAVVLSVLSCASTDRSEGWSGSGVTGTWTLNHGLSQSLTTNPVTPVRRECGIPTAPAFEPAEGRTNGDYRLAPVVTIGDETSPAPEALRRYTRSTNRIVLNQGRSTLSLTFVDARHVEIATDPAATSVSAAGGIVAWWDRMLVVEHAIGGLRIVERYSYVRASDRLIIAVCVADQPNQRFRVYERG